jgi:gamma-carbonic anhydrase
MIVVHYLEYAPRLSEPLTAHATAAVIGRADIGPHCHLGPLVTLRADGESIRVGADTWFGEASTVHIAGGHRRPSELGRHVSVGRHALVHACTIHEDCVIGEGAVVMNAAEVGPGAVIAAESVVPPGKKLAGGWLYAGVPVQPVEEVSDAMREQWHRDVRNETDAGARIGQAGAPGLWAADPVPASPLAAGTGIEPFTGGNSYVAPTASISGNVVLGPEASVWFGVILDAHGGRIEIGEASNVQDNSRLQAGAVQEDIHIGARVTIGHNVRMQSCRIEDGSMVGMGSIIGMGTVLKAGGCVAAGAVVEPGTVVESGWIWSGRPARRSRPLSDENREHFAQGLLEYADYTRNYLSSAEREAARQAGP